MVQPSGKQSGGKGRGRRGALRGSSAGFWKALRFHNSNGPERNSERRGQGWEAAARGENVPAPFCLVWLCHLPTISHNSSPQEPAISLWLPETARPLPSRQVSSFLWDGSYLLCELGVDEVAPSPPSELPGQAKQAVLTALLGGACPARAGQQTTVQQGSAPTRSSVSGGEAAKPCRAAGDVCPWLGVRFLHSHGGEAGTLGYGSSYLTGEAPAMFNSKLPVLLSPVFYHHCFMLLGSRPKNCEQGPWISIPFPLILKAHVAEP